MKADTIAKCPISITKSGVSQGCDRSGWAQFTDPSIREGPDGDGSSACTACGAGVLSELTDIDELNGGDNPAPEDGSTITASRVATSQQSCCELLKVGEKLPFSTTTCGSLQLSYKCDIPMFWLGLVSHNQPWWPCSAAVLRTMSIRASVVYGDMLCGAHATPSNRDCAACTTRTCRCTCRCTSFTTYKPNMLVTTLQLVLLCRHLAGSRPEH
jgi:hypothetical protein